MKLPYSQALDKAVERVAIREYDGGMSRGEAENVTAREMGYQDWDDMKRRIKDAKL